MARVGILIVAFVLAAVFVAPADVRADIFDFDVAWTVHSTFLLSSGAGGSAGLQGHGPGTVTSHDFDGVRLCDTVSFSDGKSGGSAGPLLNGAGVRGQSHPQFTTGLPANVDDPNMTRPQNSVFFRDNDLSAFGATFVRSNDCLSPGGCGPLGVETWTSTLTAHGTRLTSVAAPEPASAALAGLVLTAALRRRRG